MKSIRNEAPAHCPGGCESFDVEYWSLIRADQNPDLKEAILGGELNLVRCPECGMYFHHDGDLIYFDAPFELLVFVFSKEALKKEPDVQQRIKQDYEIIKNTLLKELNMDYPPISVFGLEELKEIVQSVQLAANESEVVAACAAATGLTVARLKPSYARAHHFPLYVPVLPETNTPNDYAIAAGKILKTGLNSPLLLNFKDQMSAEGAQMPELV